MDNSGDNSPEFCFATDRATQPNRWKCTQTVPAKLKTIAKILIVASTVGCVAAALGAVTFIRARSTTAREARIENLRQIDAAKERWALEESKAAYKVSVTTNNTLRTP